MHCIKGVIYKQYFFEESVVMPQLVVLEDLFDVFEDASKTHMSPTLFFPNGLRS